MYPPTWSAVTMSGTGFPFEPWKVKMHTQNASQHHFDCSLKDIWILKSSCTLKSPTHELPKWQDKILKKKKKKVCCFFTLGCLLYRCLNGALSIIHTIWLISLQLGFKQLSPSCVVIQQTHGLWDFKVTWLTQHSSCVKCFNDTEQLLVLLDMTCNAASKRNRPC